MSREKLPDTITESLGNLENLNSSLDEVRLQLDILKTRNYGEVTEDLSPIERAKLSTALAFSLSTLFYVSLNAKGVETRSHPVIDDLTRIKGLVGHLSQLEKKDEHQHKKLRIDKNAANRIITHNL
jgi:exosome complex protein LRP1